MSEFNGVLDAIKTLVEMTRKNNQVVDLLMKQLDSLSSQLHSAEKRIAILENQILPIGGKK